MHVAAGRGVEHVAVTQGELHHIAYLQAAGAVLHVQNAVVGGAADDGNALLAGQQGLQLAYVRTAQSQNGPPPDAAVLVHRLVAEGVDGEFADGVGGLVTHLHHSARRVKVSIRR